MLALALLTLIAQPKPDGKAPQPAALFARLCAPCHGADGGGKSPAGVRLPGPSLLDPKRRTAWKAEELAVRLLEGKGAMPSHKAKLKPEESTALAAWLMEGRKKR